MKKIAIASDHGGFDLKESVIAHLLNDGWEIDDLGPSNEDSVDYPDYGVKLADAIINKKVERGIVICGTGVGMSIVVNRFPGIRGTLCSDVYTAKMCREHNDSNILIMGGRVIGKGLASEIVDTWLRTAFEGGRHQRRLDKINEIDANLKSKSPGQAR
ncbi:ribose 5-phosphate isomerase B [Nitrospina gracilis]|nr:ribose 5-phosphate isomerase B [Nitrospina gracilis]